MITPHLLSEEGSAVDAAKIDAVRRVEELLDAEAAASDRQLEDAVRDLGSPRQAP